MMYRMIIFVKCGPSQKVGECLAIRFLGSSVVTIACHHVYNLSFLKTEFIWVVVDSLSVFRGKVRVLCWHNSSSKIPSMCIFAN